MIRLGHATDPNWFAASRADLAALLSDHLHCERKAAENALGLVRRYPGPPSFTQELTRLAHEETSHLVQVAALIEERGLPVRPDTPNYYTRALLAEVRGTEPERRIDALLCSALIEARSHERLSILGRGFRLEGEMRLADFYDALGDAEERHAEMFVELAEQTISAAEVRDRLPALTVREAGIIATLPMACRIH